MTAVRQRAVGYSAEALAAEESQMLTALDRGHRAKRFYESQECKDALEALKDRVWSDFKQAAEDDLVRIHADWRALERFSTFFRRQIEDGDRAEQGLQIVREQKNKLVM